MKTVPLKEAVGMVIGHDMTQILPGEDKGAAFKKGHIIQEEDIPRLLNMGKENIYVFEMKRNEIHENEAAVRMAEAARGKGIILTEPEEGKVSLIAKYTGLLKVKHKALKKINNYDRAMFASSHTNQRIEKGQLLAGTRIIPLLIDENTILEIENISRVNKPVIQVKPFKDLKVGLVITGNEVYKGRIKDKFAPVLEEKFDELGSEIKEKLYSKDDSTMIADSINKLIDKGMNFIAVTGGMSVDPDDVTPKGISRSGAEIITYGAPILPGAMFLLAYHGEIPVVGLPGCVLYYKRTVFDLVVPRLAAGERLSKNDINSLGHGGLCLNCRICTYPNCGFGKGGLN